MVRTSQATIDAVMARVRQTLVASAAGPYHQVTFRAMSTPVRICFWQEHLPLAKDLQAAVVEWIATFEARYSRFISQSIVGQINAAAGGDWVELDEQTEQLLDMCDDMYSFTGGVFDAASLPLLRLWDWRAASPRRPEAEALAAARRVSGWDKVQRRPRAFRLPLPGMGIDLGGIGKEFAVDQVMNLARARGIKDMLVDIGQDLRVSGRPPMKDAWYIGLEEPDSAPNCWACVRLTDHAVATTGDYARSFILDGRRYGHVVDPRTGEPVGNGCQAVTVVASTCAMAGILSTAAFILGPEQGLELIQRHDNAEGCITTDSARHQTRRFSRHVPF